jgi:energy-coupling factor transporter ATP-binding protein EcfA2
MESPIRTNNDYDKLLWTIIWDNAYRIGMENKQKKANIVSQLASNIGVIETTIWRWLKQDKFAFRKGTRELLLEHAGYADFEAFKNWIITEERKGGEAHLRIIKVIGTDFFLHKIYASLSQLPFMANNELFNGNDAELLFRFVNSVRLAYANESLFTSLYIVADRNETMGNISMKDYFIQLSYLTKTEITTRESLVRNETELNVLKIRRSIENNQQLTKDYVINFSLKKIQNLLVLGNPGVGKSTFVRWLCYLWSKDSNTTGNVIPLYIQLKGLEFGNNKNAIIDYIYRNYLAGDSSDDRDLHGVLRTVHSFVWFILDGYDELSDYQKERLFIHLQEISSNCKYILASRPYGILNNYDFKCDQLIQLDGFDTSNVNNYIDIFLQKNEVANGKTKERLLEIINCNPTLTDFAHNPLMLSFIVYIYLSDDNADAVLREIQTRFDLQRVVIGWMFIHNRPKVAAELDEQLIDAISKIAIEMEFEKTAEKTGNLADKDFRDVLLPVSRLGMGQLAENDIGKYKFYFNSITFQEYFASISIANNITSQALEYIMQDSYFWNLTAMIIGQISSESTSLIMDKLLASCEEELLSEEREYIFYKYVLLLSECRAHYLNTKLNFSTLQTINKAFAKAFAKYNNGHLKYAFAECVQRIYNKMNELNRTQFKEILFRKMELSWQHPNDPLLKWDSSCYHLPTLVKYLDLNLDIEFTTKCIGLLRVALEEYKQGLCEFSALWDYPDFVTAILQDNPESFFLLTRPYLEELLPLLPSSFLNFRGKIELHYVNAKTALFRLSNSIHSFNSNVDESAKEKLIGEIAIYTFVLGKRNKEFDDEKDLYECQYKLSEAAKIISNYLVGSERDYGRNYVDGPRPIAQLAAEGLFESKNHAENYPKSIDILASLDDEYLFFDQIIQTNLHIYFDNLVNSTTSHTDGAGLTRICTMIYCIPALKNKIAFHRNKLSTLVNDYIANNSSVFYENMPISNIDYFLRLLERDEKDIYENDRRYFVEILLKNETAQLPFTRNTLFPRIIQKHITIYNSTYWDFILSFLVEKDESSIQKALLMFTNSSIYQYATNLQYIHKLLSFLVEIQKHTFYSSLIKSQTETILVITGNVLKMLKQSKNESRYTLNLIVPFTGEILKQDCFKKEIKNNLSRTRRTGACNSAYILQYYFVKDVAFDLNIDYWEELPKNRKEVIEYIYSAFVQQGSLPESDLDKIKEVTGEKFINELQNERERMKVHQFPFVKEEFTSLCSI